MTMQTINTHVKETSRGFRIWIEGSKLAEAGFVPNARFNLYYNTGSNPDQQRIELRLHPEGKRKVSNSQRNGQDRPIIDIESKKIGSFFHVNSPITIFLDKGQIHIFQTPSWGNLEKRMLDFLNTDWLKVDTTPRSGKVQIRL